MVRSAHVVNPSYKPQLNGIPKCQTANPTFALKKDIRVLRKEKREWGGSENKVERKIWARKEKDHWWMKDPIMIPFPHSWRTGVVGKGGGANWLQETKHFKIF